MNKILLSVSLLFASKLSADTLVSGNNWSAIGDVGDIESLDDKFKANVKKLIDSCKYGGLEVQVFKARRPAIQQYCMHWAWNIAREGHSKKHGKPPAMGHHGWGGYYEIDWFWDNPRDTDFTSYAEKHELPSYKAAALEMVEHYGLKRKPPITSKYTEGKAATLHVIRQIVVNKINDEFKRDAIDTYSMINGKGIKQNIVIGKGGISGSNIKASDNMEWQEFAATFNVHFVKDELSEMKNSTQYSDDGNLE